MTAILQYRVIEARWIEAQKMGKDTAPEDCRQWQDVETRLRSSLPGGSRATVGTAPKNIHHQFGDNEWDNASILVQETIA